MELVNVSEPFPFHCCTAGFLYLTNLTHQLCDTRIFVLRVHHTRRITIGICVCVCFHKPI